MLHMRTTEPSGANTVPQPSSTAAGTPFFTGFGTGKQLWSAIPCASSAVTTRRVPGEPGL